MDRLRDDVQVASRTRPTWGCVRSRTFPLVEGKMSDLSSSAVQWQDSTLYELLLVAYSKMDCANDSEFVGAVTMAIFMQFY